MLLREAALEVGIGDLCGYLTPMENCTCCWLLKDGKTACLDQNSKEFYQMLGLVYIPARVLKESSASTPNETWLSWESGEHEVVLNRLAGPRSTRIESALVFHVLFLCGCLKACQLCIDHSPRSDLSTQPVVIGA